MSEDKGAAGWAGEAAPVSLYNLGQMIGVPLRMLGPTLSYRDDSGAWIQICEGAAVTAGVEQYLCDELCDDHLIVRPRSVLDMSVVEKWSDIADLPQPEPFIPIETKTLKGLDLFYDAMESLEEERWKSVCFVITGRKLGQPALQERWIREICAVFGPGSAVASGLGDVVYNMSPVPSLLAKMRAAIERCKVEGFVPPSAAKSAARRASVASSAGGEAPRGRPEVKAKVDGVRRARKESQDDEERGLTAFQVIVEIEVNMILQLTCVSRCSDKYLEDRHPGMYTELAVAKSRFSTEDRKHIPPLMNGTWLEVAGKFENFCRGTIGMECSAHELFEVFVIYLRKSQAQFVCTRSGIKGHHKTQYAQARSGGPVQTDGQCRGTYGRVRAQSPDEEFEGERGARGPPPRSSAGRRY